MPIYIYEHPETKEIIEIIQRINEEHVFVKDGVKWNRILTVPNMAIPNSINPDSSQDFVKKTAGKNYTLGDLWDKSAELSEKRKKKYGVDPIKEKAKADYKKKTKKDHPLN